MYKAMTHFYVSGVNHKLVVALLAVALLVALALLPDAADARGIRPG